MTYSKKKTIMFYILVCFVSIILSVWSTSIMHFKTQENITLQNQVDSLILITETLESNIHIIIDDDTTHKDITNLIPKNKVETNSDNHLITKHAIIFGIILIFIFFYVRCGSYIRKKE